MRTCIILFITAVLAFGALGCSEESVKTYVYGQLWCDECSTTSEGFAVDGTLANGGEDYYGSCAIKDGNFSFTVGSRDKAHAEGAADFYFQFEGIEGPPDKGVYEKGKEPKNDEDLYTTFDSGFVKNVNSWSFSPDDEEDPDLDLCFVQLFAEPESDELTPTDQPFDYFVKINCGNIAVETSGVELNNVEAELWFDNC